MCHFLRGNIIFLSQEYCNSKKKKHQATSESFFFPLLGYHFLTFSSLKCKSCPELEKHQQRPSVWALFILLNVHFPYRETLKRNKNDQCTVTWKSQRCQPHTTDIQSNLLTQLSGFIRLWNWNTAHYAMKSRVCLKPNGVVKHHESDGCGKWCSTFRNLTGDNNQSNKSWSFQTKDSGGQKQTSLAWVWLWLWRRIYPQASPRQHHNSSKYRPLAGTRFHFTQD